MLFNSRYRELILFKAYADLTSEASRTYLSFLWWIFDPILSMSVYYFVFGVLLQRGTADYVPFLLVGMVTWQWFINTVNHGMTSIWGNAGLMNQVYLPKTVFPSVVIIMDAFKFLIVFTLILLFLWVYGFSPNITYLALPAIFAVEFLFITAVTWFIAAIIPFVPDLRFLVQAVLQLVFFLSGIFFSSTDIPAGLRKYFYLNPMATIIEDYRNILMHAQWPNWNALALIGLSSLLAVFLAGQLIRRYDFVYPRII